jgi:hypothetical protein
MRRRDLIRWLLSAAAALPIRSVRLWAQGAALSPGDEDTLRALAGAVLPSSLGREGIDETADRFLSWVRGYREGAEMDHGYGLTRLRRTRPSPARGYPDQLAALEREARTRGGSFASLAPEARRAIVASALERAGVEDLPERPDGVHVAADLMSFFYRSSEANDLCYRAAIGRDACVGLPATTKRPAPLARGR